MHMLIHTHTYTYTYICKCSYTRAHTYTYTCTCTNAHTRIDKHTHNAVGIIRDDDPERSYCVHEAFG